MQNEWQIADLILNLLKLFKGQAFPVCRVDTMNVANTARKEVNAEVGRLVSTSGSSEPSYITEVNPASIALKASS